MALSTESTEKWRLLACETALPRLGGGSVAHYIFRLSFLHVYPHLPGDDPLPQ